uniref:Uncharacterized protein n=1 Tax=Dunaliella tertiolecta TaxID=3047 RepID=A0A7S3R1T0_DUNTE|eukprot:1141252-Pelagomonas_calceolata.AAC.4
MGMPYPESALKMAARQPAGTLRVHQLTLSTRNHHKNSYKSQASIHNSGIHRRKQACSLGKLTMILLSYYACNLPHTSTLSQRPPAKPGIAALSDPKAAEALEHWSFGAS